MSTALTKKQQKAQAFRSKQKAKKGGKEDVVPDDVPEQDLVEEGVDDQPEPTVAETSKKRKRDETVAEKKDVKGKGKAKTAWDEEEGEGETKSKKQSKKEIKQRFILFVGNLGYKTTKEEVQAHFAEAAGDKPSVRLLTTKPTKPSEQPKSRGIAFIELPTSTAMQACLKLHHSSIAGRRINVELTAGGGGKSEARSEKIKSRNERVGGQRERRAEREKEAEGQGAEGGHDLEQEQGVEEGGKRKRARRENGDKSVKPVEVVREDGETIGPDGEKVKIRGGRRVKVKPQTKDFSKGKNQGGFAGGQDRRNDRSSGRPQHGGRPQPGGARGFKPKWEPTGANAVSVG